MPNLNQIYQSLDPVAIQLGPFAIYWYGLAYLFGFMGAVIVVWKTIKRWQLNISLDELLNVVIGIAFGVLIGGRLGYVLFYGAGYYWAHPQDILNIRQGGMSFHGGLVGAILGGALVCKYHKISYATMADLGVIGAPIGLFFGRCANFINGELWGKPTSLPWGVRFETGGFIPRHPSQLYEACLEGLVLFIILFALSRKTPARPQGTFLGVFLLGYGIARFLVEFVRVPDAQLGYLFGGVITMGQILSLPLIVIGCVCLWFAHSKKRPQRGSLA